MLCQIAVGSLYLFGVPRGYTDRFYGWCKHVIATCLTDHNSVFRLAEFYVAPAIGCGNLPVCNRSTEDC